MTKTDDSKRSRLIFEPLDSELDHARFGRNRFLRVMGGFVFGGTAAVVVKGSPVYAAACSTSLPGAGCHGYPRCNCCSATACCAPSCFPLTGVCSPTDDGYPDGPNYWSTCQGGFLFDCADFTQSCDGGTHNCICRFHIGTC
jgi:hypothetical protein